MAYITAFELAAPEMFTEFTMAPTEAGIFGELTSAAAPAVAETLGAAELASNLSPFASQAAGAYGGSGITQAKLAENVLAGGGGAGKAGINEALINAQQAKAAELANSGINEVPVERFANTTNVNFPQTNPEPVQSAMYNPAAQPGAAMNAPYKPYNPLDQVPGGRLPPAMTGPSTTGSPFMGGFEGAMEWAKQNPWSAGSMAANALMLLGKQKQDRVGEEPYKGGILQKYKMSNDFKGRFANPQDYQYTPKVYNMAEGGIAQIAGGGPIEAMSNANAVGANTGYPMADIRHGAYATPYQQPISRNVISDSADTGVDPMSGEMRFAEGGKASLEDQLAHYGSMMSGKKPAAPTSHGDVGIYYDLDPDTRYQDALTAAQIRQAKVNKRANMQLPGMKRPTPMGQLNLAPPGMKAQESSGMTEAAHGGIMSLGGYAAGGNPRLLKGPGDGMSDNIPATIAGKQPARLADGEFVVPADVVSHLGNGSTDAGAKKLHQMMTNVRKARTGNPKQGKQINPNKFVPK